MTIKALIFALLSLAHPKQLLAEEGIDLKSVEAHDKVSFVTFPNGNNISVEMNEQEQVEEKAEEKLEEQHGYHHGIAPKIKCAAYKRHVADSSCFCGEDVWNLCPTNCNEYAIIDFCYELAGLYGGCVDCLKTCPWDCIKYVKSCCACEEAEIVSLTEDLFHFEDEEEDLDQCIGPKAFSECDLLSILTTRDRVTNDLFTAAKLARLFEHGLLDGVRPCEVVFPFTPSQSLIPGESINSQSIWVAVSSTVNSFFKLNKKGPGFRMGCGGKAEALLLWKAKPTVARITVEGIPIDPAAENTPYSDPYVYEIEIDSGFLGRNKCGTAYYTCHEGGNGKSMPYTTEENIFAEVEKEVEATEEDIDTTEDEDVDAAGCSDPVVYYRDVIKDCCGWFISNHYKQDYRPPSCDRQWYAFDPYPTGDYIGIVGTKQIMPCFTNIEWVGILVSATRSCYGTCADEAVDVIDEHFYAKVPIIGCDACCNDECRVNVFIPSEVQIFLD